MRTTRNTRVDAATPCAGLLGPRPGIASVLIILVASIGVVSCGREPVRKRIDIEARSSEPTAATPAPEPEQPTTEVAVEKRSGEKTDEVVDDETRFVDAK